MFNSPVINLIILLSFTYFIGSLILTSVNEFIAALFRLRQKQLQFALENLFPGTNWEAFVQGTLIKSPHLQSLMKTATEYPAYIPAKSFVSALIQQVGSGNFSAANVAQLPAAITASPIPVSMQQVMLDLLAKAQNNLTDFQNELETFYNDAMDRAGGWYKRNTRTILLIIGGVIAIILNLDTIKIVQNSLKDTTQLSKTIDNITSQMNNTSLNNGTIVITDKNNKPLVSIKNNIDSSSSATMADSVKDSTAKETVHTMKKDAQNVKNLQILYDQDTGYTLGYDGWENIHDEWFGKDDNCSEGFWIFLRKLLGLLITVFALQLGSNYWFDTLNKVINIRAAGKKPDDDNK